MPRLPNNIDDENAIIRAAQTGDLGAFEALVNLYRRRVLAIAYNLVNNRDDAQDIAQNVFIRLYRYLPKFDPKRTFFTWLYQMTVNASYDFLRRNKRLQTVEIDDAEIENVTSGLDSAVRLELTDKLGQLLHALPLDQKTTFILRDVEGLSVKETAEILQQPAGTIKSHLHHARKKLKGMIQQKYPDLIEGSPYEV